MQMMIDVVDATVDSAVKQIMAEAEKQQRNAGWRGWIESGPLHIYFRLTNRYILGKPMPTLEIANISVDPYYQNNGIFTKLLDQLEQLKPRKVLYIENIMGTSDENQIRLREFLERRGFSDCGIEIPCMMKVL